jgi:hypothetical protein
MKQAVLSALALTLVATPTSPYVASTSGDCGPSYVGFLERLSSHSEAMSGERLATLHRDGLRIFDACDCGHLSDVRARFAALEKRQGLPFDNH